MTIEIDQDATHKLNPGLLAATLSWEQRQDQRIAVITMEFPQEKPCAHDYYYREYPNRAFCIRCSIELQTCPDCLEPNDTHTMDCPKPERDRERDRLARRGVYRKD